MKNYLGQSVLVILALVVAMPTLGDSADEHRDRSGAAESSSGTTVVRQCSCHSAMEIEKEEKLKPQSEPARRTRELRDR